MRDQERDHQDRAGHGITRDGEIPFERREIGRVFECRREQQRSEHDQERERKQRHRGDQHIANRLEPQQEPIARFHHAVSAIEADAQALDSVRSEIDRERHTHGEHIAARGGEHLVDLIGDRTGNLLRPSLQQQPRSLVGERLGAKRRGGERGHHDEERKQGHQRRKRDMARDRPAVIGDETIISVERDAGGMRSGLQRGASITIMVGPTRVTTIQ